jgi:hypothetical protein
MLYSLIACNNSSDLNHYGITVRARLRVRVRVRDRVGDTVRVTVRFRLRVK